jgi:hypothetical protein
MPCIARDGLQDQVYALHSGIELQLPQQAVIDKTCHLYKPTTRLPFGEMEWPAMPRYLDRRDSSYRD